MAWQPRRSLWKTISIESFTNDSKTTTVRATHLPTMQASFAHHRSYRRAKHEALKLLQEQIQGKS